MSTMSNSKPYAGLAVVTDLDGTLLLPDKTLSPMDAAAIADFRAKGGTFSIATGRGIQATRPYFDLLQPDCPVILYNGSLLYDAASETVCEANYLPISANEILCELMRRFPEAGAEVLNLAGVFVLQDGAYERKHLEITHITPVFRTLEEIPAQTCFKALFAGAPEVIDAMLQRVTESKAFAGVSYTRSHEWFLEVLPAGVHKGAGLSKLRQRLPAGMRIGASGDFHNDLELLLAADDASCPANAQPIVREQVTAHGGYCSPKSCAEGFFADWLRWFCAHATA